MMSYHLAGLISAMLSTLALTGVLAQARLIWCRRWRGTSEDETPTAVLSLNRFVTSFLVFFAFFVYGSLLEQFNHYLVWPRMVAIVLVLAILFELYRDLRSRLAALAFFGCAALFLVSIPMVLNFESTGTSHPYLGELLVVVVSMIYAQGGLMQIRAIRRARATGGLSRTMHHLFLLKDLSLIVFAGTMGWQVGWPVLLLSSVGIAVQMATLWHFRWIARSKPCTARSPSTDAWLAVNERKGI